MRKQGIILLMLLLPAILLAQGKEYSQIFAEYEDIEGVESVSISPKALLGLFSGDGKKDELFSKIESLKILVLTVSNNKQTVTLFNSEIREFLTQNSFVEVMKVNSDGEKMQMFSKEKELIFITESSLEYVALYIYGDIDEELMKDVMGGEISFK